MTQIALAYAAMAPRPLVPMSRTAYEDSLVMLGRQYTWLDVSGLTPAPGHLRVLMQVLPLYEQVLTARERMSLKSVRAYCSDGLRIEITPVDRRKRTKMLTVDWLARSLPLELCEVCGYSLVAREPGVGAWRRLAAAQGMTSGRRAPTKR